MCPKIKNEDLTLLASGELNGFRARRIRQHIAHCAACRAAWANVHQLWLAASARTEEDSMSLNTVLHETTWKQLKALPQAQPNSNERKPAAVRVILGAATAAAVLLGAFLARIPSSEHRQTGIAFAQVEEAMGNIRTVTWRETAPQQLMLYPNGRSSVKNVARKWVLWARLQDPALVRLRGTQLRTVTLPSESYQIFEEEGGRSYSAYSNGIEVPEVFGPRKKQSPEERLRAAILFSPNATNTETENWVSRSRQETTQIQSTPWVSSDTVLNGRKLLRFDRVLHYSPNSRQTADGWQKDRKVVIIGKGISRVEQRVKGDWQMDRKIWTFWIEPQTYRIVRREVKTRYAASQNSVESVMVSDQFQYNRTPPQGLFEIKPPIGSRYRFVPLSQGHATPEERGQIESVIRGAMNARNRKGINGFADFWDFDYEVGTRKQNDYRRREVLRTAAQILSGKVSVKSFGGASRRISGVFTQRAETTPFPPKQSNEFTVSSTVTVEDTRDKPLQRLLLLDMSRQEDGSFKLIRWYVMRPGPR